MVNRSIAYDRQVNVRDNSSWKLKGSGESKRQYMVSSFRRVRKECRRWT